MGQGTATGKGTQARGRTIAEEVELKTFELETDDVGRNRLSITPTPKRLFNAYCLY